VAGCPAGASPSSWAREQSVSHIVHQARKLLLSRAAEKADFVQAVMSIW